MGVILVTAMITVTKCFFHRGNWFWRGMVLAFPILVQISILLMSGCKNPTSDIPYALGGNVDVTEDLYHRLKAGLFEAGKDPVICEINQHSSLPQKLRFPFHSSKAPYTMIRVAWERGSFWVESDDRALVVIYMDPEAIFSHVQITTLEGFGATRQFRYRAEHPIR